MEDTSMQSSPISTPPAAPVAPIVAAPPVVAPIVAEPAAPPVTPAPPSMESGGMAGPAKGSFDFLKDINWMETTLIFLASYGLMWTIKYYRFKIKEDRAGNHAMQREVDRLTQKVGKLELAQMHLYEGGQPQNFDPMRN